MANPTEVPRWRPQEFRLLPPAEAPAEAPSSDLLEAASILTLVGGATVGSVAFLSASPACMTAEGRLAAKPEIGLAVGFAASVGWAIITGDIWAGGAGAAGALGTYMICRFA